MNGYTVAGFSNDMVKIYTRGVKKGSCTIETMLVIFYLKNLLTQCFDVVEMWITFFFCYDSTSALCRVFQNNFEKSQMEVIEHVTQMPKLRHKLLAVI